MAHGVAAPSSFAPMGGRGGTYQETSSQAPPRRLQREGTRRRWFAVGAVAPAVLLVSAVMLFPIADTIYHSFTAWSGTSARFIGFENFRLLIQNGVFRSVLLNSVIFLVSVPLILISSLVAAVLVYEHVRGWRLFRFLFFIPGVLSSVIVGSLFSTFFQSHGLANVPLTALGAAPIQWLAHAWTARVVIVLALVWSSFGFGMVVLLSAMSGIDPALYEAAQLDGASWWTRLRRITLPLVRESIQFLSVINVIYTFTSLFGFVFVITAGGPGFSTTTLDYYTYITTFENGQFGYGAALAVVLFIIVLVLTIAQLVMFPPADSQQGA